MASPLIVTLTQENFAQQVLQSPAPVLVDFWAEWCGPCKMIAPLLDELADEYDGKVKIGKVNIDEQQSWPPNTASAPFPRCWFSRMARWPTRSSARAASATSRPASTASRCDLLPGREPERSGHA